MNYYEYTCKQVAMKDCSHMKEEYNVIISYACRKLRFIILRINFTEGICGQKSEAHYLQFLELDINLLAIKKYGKFFHKSLRFL